MTIAEVEILEPRIRRRARIDRVSLEEAERRIRFDQECDRIREEWIAAHGARPSRREPCLAVVAGLHRSPRSFRREYCLPERDRFDQRRLTAPNFGLEYPFIDHVSIWLTRTRGLCFVSQAYHVDDPAALATFGAVVERFRLEFRMDGTSWHYPGHCTLIEVWRR